MFNKTKHKLDWLKTRKQNTQAMQKQKLEGEREKKWLNHLEPFSFHTLEEPFCFANPWFGGEGEELKPLNSKGTWGFWVDLQEEQKRMKTDSGFLMISYCCSVEWLTTCSN